MKNILPILFAALLFTSCEKTIELKYKNNQPAIIIEGNITNAAGPYYVKISKSVSLADAGTYPTVNNATVTISDNAGNSETLLPQGNGLYRTTAITGTAGRTYTLTVQAEGQSYAAQSSMAQRVVFDSIKIEKLVVLGETEYNLIPVYNDPVAKGNNYQFILSVNNKLVAQHFIQNDEIKNGVANTLRLEVNDNDTKIKSGDQIAIKMLCIDKNVASYYTTLMLMADSGPGGGTTPSNPPTNFSNGALGVFSAHTVEEKIKVVQ